MKGLELSRKYFEEYGRGMLESKFPEYKDRIAAGLVGQGSEKYGFDDEISRDHDFCAGFCLWLNDDDYEKIGFELSREYRKLADEFMGFPTREKATSAGSRYGVMTVSGFFSSLVGENYANLSAEDYLYMPSSYLADATNGEIFYDRSGKFTEIYEKIKYGMPEDVRLKKIAANLAGMAQSGQYNYKRCINHAQFGAAVLSLTEFVKYAAHTVFLLNKKHAPFYKWLLYGMSKLEILGNLSSSLEFLLTFENSESSYSIKSDIIEDVCLSVAKYLKGENLSDSDSDYLEDHALSVTRRIKDANIRNLHLMTGASE
jgi:hypothetical protein